MGSALEIAMAFEFLVIFSVPCDLRPASTAPSLHDEESFHQGSWEAHPQNLLIEAS
jgi:hypothetical protein